VPFIDMRDLPVRKANNASIAGRTVAASEVVSRGRGIDAHSLPEVPDASLGRVADLPELRLRLPDTSRRNAYDLSAVSDGAHRFAADLPELRLRLPDRCGRGDSHGFLHA